MQPNYFMELTQSKTKIKSLFNNENSISVVEQTFLLDEAKEEFLDSLNQTFGTDGVYFEALESKIEMRGFKPSYTLPKFSVHHRQTNDSLGVLDAQNKRLTLNIESRIQTLDERIYNLKQQIIDANNQISNIEDSLSRKKLNIFVQLFQRKKLKRMEIMINNLKTDVAHNQNSVYAAQSVLQAEQDMAAIFKTLSNEMIELGISIENA